MRKRPLDNPHAHQPRKHGANDPGGTVARKRFAGATFGIAASWLALLPPSFAAAQPPDAATAINAPKSSPGKTERPAPAPAGSTKAVAGKPVASAGQAWGPETFLPERPNVPDEVLAAALKPIIAGHKGELAIAVKHLPSGRWFGHRADEPMPTASLIKAAIMVEAYRQIEEGRLDLARPVEVRKEDMVPGSGVLTRDFSPGLKLPVRDLIQLMIVHSDNTATNLVVDQIGLPATSAFTAKLGLPNTRLHSKVFRRDTSVDLERSKRFGLGSTTAAESVRLFTAIRGETILTPARCQAMLRHLALCEDHDLIQRHLPPGTVCYHKTGAVNDSRTDAGVIETPAGPVALAILTTKNTDQRWINDNAAELVMAELAVTVYRHFNPSWKDRTPGIDQPLKVGSEGPRVAALQRTLAARLGKEAEALSADGDFGGQTESFVKLFQRKKGLAETGVVDAATWKALGPIAERETPAPDPAKVNAEVAGRKPADDPGQPPFTTCKAWAIADGTGKVLWQHQGSRRLDMASTTKMMTCYVVLKLAQKNPEVLHEKLTFSKRADETVGSTADVREGESLTVGELLYGLMLPSGNDAATALAEHFGPRLAQGELNSPAPPPAAPGGTDPNAAPVPDSDPALGFIAAMNRAAKELGMADSSFQNPHGLTAKGHHSSGADLVKLAHAAWSLPTFRNLVGTARHGSTVTGASGYQRNVVWKNTNELLGIEGYDGVKTGTTSAAGACLVASGERDGQRYFVAVLGSTTSDARYVDARNLFRWAWSQRR